mgnify:CR=1 FL=1
MVRLKRVGGMFYLHAAFCLNSTMVRLKQYYLCTNRLFKFGLNSTMFRLKLNNKQTFTGMNSGLNSTMVRLKLRIKL